MLRKCLQRLDTRKSRDETHVAVLDLLLLLNGSGGKMGTSAWILNNSTESYHEDMLDQVVIPEPVADAYVINYLYSDSDSDTEPEIKQASINKRDSGIDLSKLHQYPALDMQKMHIQADEIFTNYLAPESFNIQFTSGKVYTLCVFE